MRKLSNPDCRPMYLILALVVLLSGDLLALEQEVRVSAQVVGPSWSLTGSLNTARALHTATLLASGKLLVAGGSSFNAEPHFLRGSSRQCCRPESVHSQR